MTVDCLIIRKHLCLSRNIHHHHYVADLLQNVALIMAYWKYPLSVAIFNTFMQYTYQIFFMYSFLIHNCLHVLALTNIPFTTYTDVICPCSRLITLSLVQVEYFLSTYCWQLFVSALIKLTFYTSFMMALLFFVCACAYVYACMSSCVPILCLCMFICSHQFPSRCWLRCVWMLLIDINLLSSSHAINPKRGL